MQGGNLVVELLAALVETARAVGQHLRERRLVDDAIVRQVGGDFEQGQRATHVAVGGLGDQTERVVVDFQIGFSESALFVVQRASKRRDDGLDRYRIHDMHAAARQQRRIELERGILGRRADKDDHAAFDVRQERILLCLVEAVHFVDEQHAALALGEARFRFGQRRAHFGDAGQHRRDRAEFGLGVLCQQQRERGLAAAWRPPQHH